MFRSRRTNLVKRLWKARVTTSQDEDGRSDEGGISDSVSDEMELKSVAQSLLKRLKERQLTVLIQAVESRGGDTTECLPFPRGDVRLGRRTVAPHVLCCQVWRWPNLQADYLLKRMPCCTSAGDTTTVCCNPYHWSRHKPHNLPDSPPPPYSETAIKERVFIEKDGPSTTPEKVVSTETGDSQDPTPFTPDDSTGSSNRPPPPLWCKIAYWELRQRVGRQFTVFEPTVNVFHELPHGDGMCLGVLQQPTECESVSRTRAKIGYGMTLSKEPDGVWVYNRSEHALFVNSSTLDIPNSRTFIVHKVLPGYCMKVFDYERAEVFERIRDPQFSDGPYDPNSIRISFAKGWGACYSRQFVLSCPCWVEVLLRRVDR